MQTKLYRRFLAFFKDVRRADLPRVSVSPFPHAQLFVEQINGEKMPTYMRWLAITYAPTVALACATAIPCGVDHVGMPFGIQVIGPNGSDARMLEVCARARAGNGPEQRNGAAYSPLPVLRPCGAWLRHDERAGVRGGITHQPLASIAAPHPAGGREEDTRRPHPTGHTDPRPMEPLTPVAIPAAAY